MGPDEHRTLLMPAVLNCVVLVGLFYICKHLPASPPPPRRPSAGTSSGLHPRCTSGPNGLAFLWGKMLRTQYTTIIVRIPLEVFRICYVFIFHVHEDNKILKTYLLKKTYLLIREMSHKTGLSQKKSDPILFIYLLGCLFLILT